MNVAACQLLEIRNDMSRAIALLGAQTLAAERLGANLVCFPECFLQGYSVDPAHVANVAIDLSSPAFHDMLGELKPLEPVILVSGSLPRTSTAGHTSAWACASDRWRIGPRLGNTGSESATATPIGAQPLDDALMPK